MVSQRPSLGFPGPTYLELAILEKLKDVWCPRMAVATYPRAPPLVLG